MGLRSVGWDRGRAGAPRPACVERQERFLLPTHPPTHAILQVLAGYHESQAKLSFFQGLGQQLADPSALKGHLRHTLAVLTEQVRGPGSRVRV